MHHTAHVADYVTGAMPERKRAAMRAHLERCPECRDLVADYRRTARRRATMAQSMGGESVDVDTKELLLLGTRRRRMVSNAVPVIGSLVTVLAFVAVLFAAWNAGGRADAADLAVPTESFTQTGAALSDYEIADLRRAGWTCPDLRPIGLTMTSSTGTRVGDDAWVTITYSGNGRAVVLTETRAVAGDHSGTVPVTAAGEAGTTIDAGGARYVLHSSMGESANRELTERLHDIADDREEDAAASTLSGWDRLSRGFSRLVDPTR